MLINMIYYKHTQCVSMGRDLPRWSNALRRHGGRLRRLLQHVLLGNPVRQTRPASSFR